MSARLLVWGQEVPLDAFPPEALLGVCVERTALFARVVKERPDAVLVNEPEPATFVGLISGLRVQRVPVVVLSADVTVPSVLRWLRLGASDVRPLRELTPEVLEGLPDARVPLVERTLVWASRVRLSGALRVLPQTPLEGVAEFEAGVLRSASFCWLEGEAALAEMLAMEGTELSFSTTPRAPVRPGYAPRVLVVEDDPAIRRLLARTIEREGYRVFEAGDGLEGFEIVQRERLDLVVADLDMPRIDGWGLLRAMRDELATREVPVVLLSAHEDAVTTLKAARAGARAYLKKTGRTRELIDSIALLTSERRRVWSALQERVDVPVECLPLGAVWLLDTLAELDVGGRLELEDTLGRYEVTLRSGRLQTAVAQQGSLRVTGPSALEALVCSTGRGRFVFSEVAADEDAPWLSEVLQRVTRTLSLDAADRARELARSPRRLRVDDELAHLYARVATTRELRLLDGLKRAPASLDELSTLTELPAPDVTRMMGELLRRGVIAEHR